MYKGFILALVLCNAPDLHAEPLIDHVNNEVQNNQEIVEIIFNTPVQYLYHTPKSGTKTMLLGFYIHPSWKQSRSWHRPISFKRTKYLQSMDIYSEQGFNPHLYLEFNTFVNIQVQPRKNLRGFVLTLSEQEK